MILVCGMFIPGVSRGFALVQPKAGQAIGWAEASVPVFLDVRSVGGHPIAEVEWRVQEALTAWNEIPCSELVLDYAGLVVESPGFGITVHPLEPGVGHSALADGAAGITDTFHGSGGVIYRADIHLSTDALWSLEGNWMAPGVVDVQAVVTHELGHAVGIAHSRERSATMYFAGGTVTLRTLEEDDQRALCTLYPAEDVPSGQSCDSCAHSSDCETGSCLLFPFGGAFCALECQEHADCAGGFSCLEVAGETGLRCLPSNGECAEAGGNISVGDYCYGSATCDSGRCLVTPQAAYCTEECSTADSSACPAELRCIQFSHSTCEAFAGEECGTCTVTGEGVVGDMCWDASDCEEGTCLLHSAGGNCGSFCVNPGSVCPEGSLCSLGICASGGVRPTGAPCSSPFQCEGAFCTEGLQGESVCAESCEVSATCPFNSTCLAVEENTGCGSDSDCLSGICRVETGQCVCEDNSHCGLGLICEASATSPEVSVCQVRLCVALNKKGKSDEFCDVEQGCVGELACEPQGTDWGRCRPTCTPFSGEMEACPEGACRWIGLGSDTDTLQGVCSVREGGSVGEFCDETTACTADLLCVAPDGESGECRLPCPPEGEAGCQAPQECALFLDAEFEGQGACASPSDTPWRLLVWNAEAMPPLSTADPLPVGGGQFESGTFVTIEAAILASGRGEGCRHTDAPVSSGALVLMLGWMLHRARARRSAG